MSKTSPASLSLPNARPGSTGSVRTSKENLTPSLKSPSRTPGVSVCCDKGPNVSIPQLAIWLTDQKCIAVSESTACRMLAGYRFLKGHQPFLAGSGFAPGLAGSGFPSGLAAWAAKVLYM